MTRPQGETGSVLIEALVAVLIVAAMAGLWFETVSSGAGRQRNADDRRTAMLVAQSQLATVGVLRPVVPGETSGSDGSMAWRIAVDPHAEAGPAVYRVRVTVGSASGRTLARLETLRFGR